MRLRCFARPLALMPMLKAVALGADGSRLIYPDESCDPLTGRLE